MLGDGRVLAIAAPAHVRGDPFALEEDLDRPRGQTCIDFARGRSDSGTQ